MKDHGATASSREVASSKKSSSAAGAAATSTTAEETKRSKRERKQVSLLSDEYQKIYDHANNRKIKPKPAQVVEKKKETSKELEKEITKIISSTTTYQWIGPGTKGKKEDEKEECLYFQKLEIKVGNHPALIQIGDNVLLSRGDTTETDVFDKSTLNRSINDDAGNQDQEVVDKSQVAMNTLNPYIGKVISMWEEEAVGTDSSSIVRYKDTRRSKMKVLVQWYYNRLDVTRLKGQFDGCSRSVALSYMRNPRMLFLGTVSDVNDVSTVLGKCHVIRNSPGHVSPGKFHNVEKSQEEGSFLCDFDIIITPANGKGGKDKITIVPFQTHANVEGDGGGGDDIDDGKKPDGEEEEITPPPTKKSRIANSSMDSDDNETQETTSLVATESEEGSSLEEVIKEPNELKAPTTEGSATQKIMVGENHQAVIPVLTKNARGKYETSRDAPPMLVWKPDSISDAKLHKFVQDVEQLLMSHMKNKDIELLRTVPPDLDPRHLPSGFTCREIRVDQVLKLLHDKSYNIDLALKVIKASPHIYLDNWTRREKEMYNIGFKRHYSAIRLIAKEIGPTKTHKDVVDYHYRYKIPDQFQRYQDKKRELARKMLDCIEKHRLGELSSAETPQTVNNTSGSGPKKFHSWARTGGGDSKAIGNLEARRLGAKDFLIVLKETIGVVKYLKLVNQLKSLHAKVITIPQCREIFKSELQDHPELLRRFDHFLPKEFTGSRN